MAKWEYKTVTDKYKIYNEKYLNYLGDKGWKLCGVITPLGGGPVLYFIREVFVCYPPPD